MQRLLLLYSMLHSASSGLATPEDEKCYHKMKELLNHDMITMAPRLSMNHPTVVDFAAGFMGLQEVIEKENRIVLMMELEFRWEDHRMEWEEHECVHQEMTIYPASKIWFPWLMITNHYEQNVWSDMWDNNPVQVYRNGSILWEWAKKFNVLCLFDLEKFPVDKQKCKVAITLMSNIGVRETHDLDMDPNIRYINNDIWDVSDAHMETEKMKFNMTEVLIHFHIKRKISFYMFSLILPSITLSLLPCFPFIVPADSGEKNGIALTTLLTYFVMSLSFFDTIPTTSSLPLLAVSFLYQTVLSGVAALITTIICRMDAKEKKKAEEKEHCDNKVYPLDVEAEKEKITLFSAAWWKSAWTAEKVNTICFYIFLVASVIPVLVVVVDIYAV